VRGALNLVALSGVAIGSEAYADARDLVGVLYDTYADVFGDDYVSFPHIAAGLGVLSVDRLTQRCAAAFAVLG